MNFSPGVMDPNFIAAGAREQVLKAVSKLVNMSSIKVEFKLSAMISSQVLVNDKVY